MSVGECGIDTPSTTTTNNCGAGSGGGNGGGSGGSGGGYSGAGGGTSGVDNSFNGDYIDAGSSLGMGNLSSRSAVGDVAAEDVSRFDNAYETSVPDKRTATETEYGSVFDPASHTGDKSLSPDTPAEPEEADADLSFTDQVGGFFSGMYEVGKEAVTGTVDLVSNAASMSYDVTFGPPVEALEMAAEYVTGVDINLPDFAPDTARGYGKVEAAGEVIGAVIDDPGAVYDAIADPIKEDWNAGRKGEAIGRGVAEVIGAVAGTKGLDKAAKAGRLGDLATDVPAGRPINDGPAVRGDQPLTETQVNDARAYAEELGVPRENIATTSGNTAYYGGTFDTVTIGPDLAPATDPRGLGTKTANDRISERGAIAHEVVGHRDAELAGKTHPDPQLEEVQASVRAARHAPDLTSTERVQLQRDAVSRLDDVGLGWRDVRDDLWLD